MLFGKKIANVFKNLVTNFKDFQNNIKEMKKKNATLKVNFGKSFKSMGEPKIDFLNLINHCVENHKCLFISKKK